MTRRSTAGRVQHLSSSLSSDSGSGGERKEQGLGLDRERSEQWL